MLAHPSEAPQLVTEVVPAVPAVVLLEAAQGIKGV